MNESPTVQGLSEIDELTAQLGEAGLSRPAAKDKAELFGLCAKPLQDLGHSNEASVRAFFVPGRIEVLGKHTDYAGGRSIVAAAEKGFCMTAVARRDRIVRVVDVREGEQAELAMDGQIRRVPGDWSNYAATVVRRLAKNFPARLCGADIAFVSDLPAAAGMSSSSAMVVGFFLALSAFNELASRREYRTNIKSGEDLAGYLSAVENGQSFGTLTGDEGVGTSGGSEDHTAILCCRAGTLSQYSYCPVRLERTVKLPTGYVFAVASSGVAAEKTGPAMEKYNRISKLARCATEVCNRAAGRPDAHLAAAIAGCADGADRLRRILRESRNEPFSADELLSRFEHFVAESEEIIPAAGDALTAGNFEEFGKQVVKSQELAEKLLDNQVAETVFLAHSACRLGAVAASAFGAGFGGSVWALTEVEKAGKLIAEWSAQYKSQFPEAGEKAVFWLTRPGPAAFQLR